MKKVIPVLVIGIAIASVFMAFRMSESNPAPQSQEQPQLFPKEVATIFENSCYACHGPDGDNFKAKSKLNFGNWADWSDAKKVGKMQDISDILSKGKMPPSKYLEHNPDKALTKEQKDVINKWAEDESNKLMGEGK